MGEKENKKLGELSERKDGTEEQENQKEKSTRTGIPMRTYLIMILAGVYVAYLGVSLCQNVIKGVDGSNPGFLAAGVVFVVLGVAFVINGIKGSLKVSKAQKEQEASLGEQEGTQDRGEDSAGVSEGAKVESETSSAYGTGSDKKMSLADRANLVSRMGDVNDEDEK